MKKNIIIGAIILFIVILGVVYWPKQGWAPESAPSPAATSTPSSTIKASASSTGSGVTMTNTLGWKKYTSAAYGITLSYPAGWQTGSEQPIILDNFNNKYSPSGTIPAGGAEIDIVGTDATGPVDDIIKTELMNAKMTSTSTVSAAGVSCKEFFYGGVYATNYPSKNIAVYCPGKTLLKIFLSYNANDPKGAAFEATFKQLLGTIQFVK